jgi:hypothetical protein
MRCLKPFEKRQVRMTNELQRLRFGKIAAYRIAAWKILIRSFFSRWIASDATVLDLGCWWGWSQAEISNGFWLS